MVKVRLNQQNKTWGQDIDPSQKEHSQGKIGRGSSVGRRIKSWRSPSEKL